MTNGPHPASLLQEESSRKKPVMSFDASFKLCGPLSTKQAQGLLYNSVCAPVEARKRLAGQAFNFRVPLHPATRDQSRIVSIW
jgi:hypothetical protein